MRARLELNLDRLGATPDAYEYERSAAWWEERSAEVSQPSFSYAVVEPFRFDLEAHKMGQDVYLAGALRSAIDVECSRCVSRYRQPLRESFRLVLEPAGSRIPADPESAEALTRSGLCLGEEIEAGWYRGSEIDLGGWFAEVVALGLPVQPLCREACLGLCPQCGSDRNQTNCGCDEEARPESPFAALAVLKQGNEGLGGD